MLYSKLKRGQINKLQDAVGLLQKPFDYNATFTKSKKSSIGNKKSSLMDQRMSLFSNTYDPSKKNGLNDIK